MIPDNTNKRFSDTKVYFWDEKQHLLLKEIECYNIITRLEFLREYLIVQVEGKFPKISLISIETMTITKVFLLNPTVSIRNSPFAMNQDENKPIIAFLRNNNTLFLYNFLSDFDYLLESKYDQIQSFIMNRKGDQLALSNKEGTYISIYCLPEKTLQVELYRGRNACKIKQMSFLSKGHYFLIHSDRETLHIYDIERKEMNYTLIPVGIMTMIQGKYLSSFAKYYITPEKLEKNKEKNSFLGDKGQFQSAQIIDLEPGSLVIIKDNGDWEKMSFDLEKGGWGVKIKEKEWFNGWDLIEDNLKKIKEILGNVIQRNLGLKLKT